MLHMIIAVCNQKGGVGKTTTTYNLATLLAMRGKRTLMIDYDSQASLTIYAGLEPLDFQDNNISVAMENNSIKKCIFPLGKIENLFIVPSIIDLASTEKGLSNAKMLDKTLLPVVKSYDYILIDCSPSMSSLNINALACSDYALIVTETSYLSYRGLNDLESTIADVQSSINSKLKSLGVLVNRYKKTSKDAKEVLSLLQENYNIIGVVKETETIKKGFYDGLPLAALNLKTKLSKEVLEEFNKVVDYILDKGETK